MISPEALRDIIRLSLRSIDKWSPEAEELLLMIAAHESRLGRHLRQMVGPARGIYQMEPDTERDIWATWLYYRSGLAEKITRLTGVTGPDDNQLTYNPIYATIMARLKLFRAPGKLPPVHDVVGMAAYAKDHYNSPRGKATVDKYVDDYRRLVLLT